MTSRPTGLLLLGTSLVGKSTCAEAVGRTLGWRVVSTDTLGRHPGRPWTGVPAPVLDYYLSLTDDTIHWFLRVHHENMRPLIRGKIDAMQDADGFVLEGAALRPEYVADYGATLAVCLHIEAQTLRQRIERESSASPRGESVRKAVEKFAERCIRENDALAEAAIRNGVELVDVTSPTVADQLARDLVSRLAR